MPDDRPNIILLMTDQQRGDCLSLANHPCLLTPNMNAIGGEGAHFTRAYSTCPVCIPARRSLMSGQFPATHGLVGYKDYQEWNAPTTLPQALKEAGYQTGLVGRLMHLHPRRKRYGFDDMILSGGDYEGNDYAQWLDKQTPDSAGGYYGAGIGNNDWTARPWHLDEALHPVNWTVSQAMRWLDRRDPTCPYFLVVSFAPPHPPLTPPAFYFERYLRQQMDQPVYGGWTAPLENGGIGDKVDPNKVHLTGERLRSARAGYYGSINHIDDQMRRLLNPVRNTRVPKNNTAIMFTADHGEMLGDHYMWRKQQPYEPSANIPLLMQTPPRFGFPTRIKIDQPVCLEDIMPTALDLAGVDIPDSVDGKSLLPLLRGENPTWRQQLHLEHSGIHQSLTNGKEKFIWFTEDGREQFFDLATDPNECKNLIDSDQDQQRISAWRKRLIETLKDRPEGFVQDGKLIAGRPYPSVMEHVHGDVENHYVEPEVND